MFLQTNSPKEATKMNTKIRTVILTLIAAASFGSAAMAPVAAQAATKQKDLTDKGLTCEHTSDNLTVCTDKEGHEWYCEESSDECGQVKLQVINSTLLRTSGLTMKAPPVVTTPPVITKVALPVTKASRAA
jgi:hypothetical protein